MVCLFFFLKAIFVALVEARGKKDAFQTNLCLLGMFLNNPSAASKSGEARKAIRTPALLSASRLSFDFIFFLVQN